MKVRVSGHRPGPLKQQNKSHKTGRHRSKSEISRESKGKSELKTMCKKTKKQMSRQARKNRIKQIRNLSRAEVIGKRRNLGAPSSPPFLVGIVSLCEGQNGEFVQNLLISCDDQATSSQCERGFSFLNVPRFKQRFSFVCPDTSKLYDVLDSLKVCDTVLLLWPIDGELSEESELLLTCMKAQGLPTYLNVVDASFSALVGKKKEIYRKALTKNFERLSLDTKFHGLETKSDALVLLRQLGAGVRKLINLQKYRSHLLAETFSITEPIPGQDAGVRDIFLTGYLRGPNLNVSSLIHITGWGDFQMKQIEVLNDPRSLNAPLNQNNCKKDVEMQDKTATLVFKSDPAKQENLTTEVTPDPMHGEQTWPNEHDMKNPTEEPQKSKMGTMKKVPAGTSTYQAAWIVDDEESADENDMESEDEEELNETEQAMEAVEDQNEAHNDNMCDDIETESVAMTETDDTERYDVRFDEEEEKAMLKRFREERENEQFPDEIDTPLDVPARVRFQRYRGLKSFRTSPWNTKENLPYDYARIFRFQDFRRTKKRVIKETNTEGPQNGAYVSICVGNVPLSLIESIGRKSPLIVYGMLAHEQKISLINIVLKKHESYTWGVKSKDSLIFHVGYRRYAASPIFSQHTNGDKFKYERFMPAESAVVASLYAPITFPPCTAMVFKVDSNGKHRLVATGAVLDVNPNRVVVKRIILSGFPFKIQKRGAVARHMFFNREDIDWFKPVELRTKYGRRGHIKESLGTHGHMKCIFDRPMNSQDTILMDLYKRVFPKWTYNNDTTMSNKVLSDSNKNSRPKRGTEETSSEIMME